MWNGSVANVLHSNDPAVFSTYHLETEDRGWWFSQSEKTYDATEVSAVDLGFEETLNSVASEIKTQGPFDGILSFSQGACLASVICMLKAKGDDRFQDFGFAIIAAGYRNGFLAFFNKRRQRKNLAARR